MSSAPAVIVKVNINGGILIEKEYGL